MTDNEKRAHDLAIAISVPKCFKEEEILRAEKKDGNVDYLAEYMSTYEDALNFFNERFSD